MAEDITLSELQLVTKDGDPVNLATLLVAAGVNLGNTVAGDLADRPNAEDMALGSLYFALDTGAVYRRNAVPDWDLVLTSGASGSPTGVAGGDLDGTYPAPTIADGVITLAMIAATLIDAAAGTASLRTLGTGAAQALPGDHESVTNARPPTGAAGGVLAGNYPDPGFSAPIYTRTEIDALLAQLAPLAYVNALMTNHAAASDPHDVYIQESQRGVENGVATLNAGGKVTLSELATGTATADKVLAGDGSWQAPGDVLAGYDGIITEEMLDVDVTDLVTAAVAAHNGDLTAHDVRGIVGLYVANADNSSYEPLAGRKIILRAAGKHDPATTIGLSNYDIVGDGT